MSGLLPVGGYAGYMSVVRKIVEIRFDDMTVFIARELQVREIIAKDLHIDVRYMDILKDDNLPPLYLARLTREGATEIAAIKGVQIKVR